MVGNASNQAGDRNRDILGGSSQPAWNPTTVEAFLLEKTFLEDVVRPLVRALVHSRLQTAGLAPGTSHTPALQRDLMGIRDSLLQGIDSMSGSAPGPSTPATAAPAPAPAPAPVPSPAPAPSFGTPVRSGGMGRPDPAIHALLNGIPSNTHTRPDPAIQALLNAPPSNTHTRPDPAIQALLNNSPAPNSTSGDNSGGGGGGGNDSDANMSIDGGPSGSMSQLSSFDMGNFSQMRRWTPAQRKRTATRHRVCAGCGIPHNSKFRRGPSGPGTLCDKCGTKWKKITDQAKLENSYLQVGQGSNSTGAAGQNQGGLEPDGRSHSGPSSSAGPSGGQEDPGDNAWHVMPSSRDRIQPQDNLDEPGEGHSSFTQGQRGQDRRHSPVPSGGGNGHGSGSGPGPGSRGSPSSSSSGHVPPSGLSMGVNFAGGGGGSGGGGGGGDVSSERSSHHSPQHHGRPIPRSVPGPSFTPLQQSRGGGGGGGGGGSGGENNSNSHPPSAPLPSGSGSESGTGPGASPQQGDVSHAAAQAFLRAMHQRNVYPGSG